MNKMNNKGFLLAESLIVATFVLTVLIYLFSQFKNLMIEYKKTYQYNTVEDIYNLGSVGKYINQNGIALNDNQYLYKNNDCTDEIPNEEKITFKNMADSMNLDYLIFADSNIEKVKESVMVFDQDMQDFIERISTNIIEGKGRLLAKFKNGNFATIIIEKIPIPMLKKWDINSDSDFHNEEIRTKITNIEFLNSPIVPVSDLPAWDVSERGDKTVMAWISNDGEGGYILHIGGEGLVLANPDSSYLFDGFNALKSISFGNNFDTSLATNMNHMFSGCNNLTALDVSKFDTSKVINMNSMFSGDNNLTTLDVSGFITNKVIDMSSMFLDCNNLMALDVSKFDTSKVTNMSSMFSGCNNITTLDVSKFDTSNVTNMNHMFNDCNNLAAADVSKFDTSKVTNMQAMFADCKGLSTLNVSNFNTSSVTDMSFMFGSYAAGGDSIGFSASEIIGIDNFDTSSVTKMRFMFAGAHNLKNLDLSKWNTSHVKNMSYMFYENKSLTNLVVSGFDTTMATDMSYMFYGCSSLSSLNVSNFNTENVKLMEAMFFGDINLESLDVSKFKTENVTEMSGLFTNCKKIQELDLSKWDTSNVTAMGPEEKTDIDTTSLYGIKGMFDGCENLKKIYASDKFNTSKVEKSSHMFFDCASLIGGNGTTFNSSKTDKEYARIDKPGQPGYFTQK